MSITSLIIKNIYLILPQIQQLRSSDAQQNCQYNLAATVYVQLSWFLRPSESRVETYLRLCRWRQLTDERQFKCLKRVSWLDNSKKRRFSLLPKQPGRMLRADWWIASLNTSWQYYILRVLLGSFQVMSLICFVAHCWFYESVFWGKK